MGDPGSGECTWWLPTDCPACGYPRLSADIRVRPRHTDLHTLNELNFARFDAKLEQRIAELRSDIERRFTDTVRWTFLFWAGTPIPIAGLVMALAR